MKSLNKDSFAALSKRTFLDPEVYNSARYSPQSSLPPRGAQDGDGGGGGVNSYWNSFCGRKVTPCPDGSLWLNGVIFSPLTKTCDFFSGLSSAGRTRPEPQRATPGRGGRSDPTHQMATTTPPADVTLWLHTADRVPTLIPEHVWRPASPPPPAGPSHSSCPL